MRRLVLGLAAAVAGCTVLWGQAEAAPLTATYEGALYGASTPFTATFHFDTNDFVQDFFDPTLFDGVGNSQYATLAFGNAAPTTIGSSEYFYERVVSGVIPDYEFGIRDTDGAFLYLKINGATQEGDYGLADGTGGNLAPARVIIAPATSTTVATVPLPPGLALFAGALLAVGVASRATSRRVAARAEARTATA